MGKKKVRGQAETEWGETKSERLSLRITRTARRLIEAIAQKIGVSQAEWLERAARQWDLLVLTLRHAPPTIATLLMLEMVRRGWSLEQTAKFLELEPDTLRMLLSNNPAPADQRAKLGQFLTKPDGTPYSDLELDAIAEPQGLLPTKPIDPSPGQGTEKAGQ